MSTRHFLSLAAVVVFISCSAIASEDEHGDGSRTRAVHLLPLSDVEGQKIIPHELGGDRGFSQKATCNQCHDYETVHGGWHFNANDPAVDPGRPGEPWVLVDEDTGTQLPISSRAWEGVWKPEDLGMTPWEFTKHFGRHTPGGGVADQADLDLDPEARWQVSGDLEINCLSCHNAAPEQNMSDWVIQLARENYEWAATAASGLGVVSGMASRLPRMWDYYDGPNLDNPYAAPPEVTYNKAYFDADQRVLLNVTKDVPANRCYFCHSTEHVDADEFAVDEDVHLHSGMTCTDCHRNELDHDIVRGYLGADSDDPARASLSCRGCHLGDAEGQSVKLAGRLGAPIPEHKGLPLSHLEAMSCTTCHGGPMADTPGLVRTSRANRMGIHGKAKWVTDLPEIQSPVFIKRDNFIEPNNILWPSFFGRKSGDDVNPMLPEEVEPFLAKAVEGEEGLTQRRVAATLAAMAASDGFEGEAVYVAGGKLHTTAEGTALSGAAHDCAKPYAWPIAHDVRPAAQALGANGCTDCHSKESGFFYGEVTPSAPLELAGLSATPMHEMMDYTDKTLMMEWETGAKLHNVYMYGKIIAVVILAIALLRYAFMGLEALARHFVVKTK